MGRAQTQSTRPFDIDDVLQLEVLSSVAPSPDGQRTAIVIDRARTNREHYPMLWVQDDARGDIWIAQNDGRRTFRLTNGAQDGAGFWDPVWSPNGTRLAMLSTRGGDAVRAYVWTVGDSSAAPVSQRAVDIWVTDASLTRHFQPLVWRDDSTLVVPFLPSGVSSHYDPVAETKHDIDQEWAAVQAGGTRSTATVLASYADSMPAYLSTEELAAINTARRTSITLFTMPRDPTTSGDREIILSPSRRLLAVLTSHLEQPNASQRLTRTSSRYSLGVASAIDTSQVHWLGEFSLVGGTYALPLLVRWAPDGHALAIVGHRVGAGSSPCTLISDPLGAATTTTAALGQHCVDAIWKSTGNRVTFVGAAGSPLEGAIDRWARQLDSGTVRPVWPAEPAAIRSAREVVVARHVVGGDTLFAANIVADSLQLRRLGYLPASWRVVGFVPGMQTVVVTRRNRAVGLLGHSGVRVLMHVNDWAERLAHPEKRSFRYSSEQGDSLTAIVLLPPDYRQGNRYPVVTWVYAGRVYSDTADVNADQFTPSAYNLGLFTSSGYVVLLPSMPLASEIAGTDVLPNLTNGVLPAVDHLVAVGIADPDRIAVAGQSFGGYSTLGLITQTHRFRTAISMAGISDLLSWYGTFRPWDRYSDYPQVSLAIPKLMEAGQGRLGASPWTNMWRYFTNSPVVFADRVRTPVMLMKGDLDFVGPGQSEEFFTAMYRLGKRAQLVRYAGESHTIESPANVRDMWLRIEHWLTVTMPSRQASTRHDR